MTDEQLERRLGVVNEPVDPDPRFAAELFADLADRLGLERSPGLLSIVGTEAVRLPRTRRGPRPWKLLLAAAILATAAAGAALVAGSLVHRDDLLTRLEGAGVVRIAVRPDFPQSAVSGLAGFDVDVATALAQRLSLNEEVRPLSASDMLGGGTTSWDLAMPSTILTSEQALGFVMSRPYYAWPVYLLVRSDDQATTPGDLAGRRVCVTAGSTGASWLTGRPVVAGAPAPPSDVSVRMEAADRDCLAALIAADVDAMVSSTMSAADLATRPSLRSIGAFLYQEPRAVLATRDGPDPSRLMDAVSEALSAMSADGTLTNLSRNRFGGGDLSVPDVP